MWRILSIRTASARARQLRLRLHNVAMPNFTAVLKAEVTRLARKELKAATDALRKTISAQRTEIAALRKRVTELERAQKQASKAVLARKPAETAATEAPDSKLRFRAAGMAANRKRLGLSAADFGRLVGATGQSVYSWEAGTSKPRSNNLAAIAALRGIGKREALERLAASK